MHSAKRIHRNATRLFAGHGVVLVLQLPGAGGIAHGAKHHGGYPAADGAGERLVPEPAPRLPGWLRGGLAAQLPVSDFRSPLFVCLSVCPSVCSPIQPAGLSWCCPGQCLPGPTARRDSAMVLRSVLLVCPAQPPNYASVYPAAVTD
jgi:hypothetical protein